MVVGVFGAPSISVDHAMIRKLVNAIESNYFSKGQTIVTFLEQIYLELSCRLDIIQHKSHKKHSVSD